MTIIFQSTLRRTERHQKEGTTHGYIQFQSTLRRTERHTAQIQASIQADFNPRSDERSDFECPSDVAGEIISIHAPTNGATVGVYLVQRMVLISIHAPTNGATPEITQDKNYKLFQSTLRRTERPRRFLDLRDHI